MAARLPSSSIHPKHAAPAAAPASLPSAPAAPAAPAQQHPTTQLRTIRPPRTPQTTGSAEWGALLSPTNGTSTPVPVFGNGASGTCLRREPCAPSARPVKRTMQAHFTDISFQAVLLLDS